MNKDNLLHKFQLLRLLQEIVDNPILAQSIYFKGGTCASLLGYLDRFSVDLDFDMKSGGNPKQIREEFDLVFKKLDLVDENKNGNSLFFDLKYKAPPDKRNTIKVSVYEEIVVANDYKPAFLPEINRLVNCQTIETMFANKLVAPVDRYQKHKQIAGRDIYDIHYFSLQGYKFKKEIIEERMKIDIQRYISMLIDFIEKNVTERILTEDLNALLPVERFQKIRKVLKEETLIFLRSLKLSNG